MSNWRDRILKHVRVRSGDLVPHELNPRLHPEFQRQALRAVYEQVGVARSLLAFQLPDGRYKLIDGHLRAGLDPDQEVTVEVLDVSEEEARVLLLSLDPLAALAEVDAGRLEELRARTSSDSDVLTQFWQQIESSRRKIQKDGERGTSRPPVEQWLILVECKNEAEQLELLERFQGIGLKCKPLMS